MLIMTKNYFIYFIFKFNFENFYLLFLHLLISTLISINFQLLLHIFTLLLLTAAAKRHTCWLWFTDIQLLLQ